MFKVLPLLFRPLLRSLVLLLQLGAVTSVALAGELLPPGFRPVPLGVHALVGGRIVVKPGETIEGGTIIIRDGLIKGVGKDLVPPADARVWDMKGTTIYAGFIDPYLVLGGTNGPVATPVSEPITSRSFTASGVRFFGAPGAQTDMGNPGPGYEIARITPERRAVEDYSPKDKVLTPLRELGFTAGVVAPGKGIIRGTSALVALAEENPNQVVLKPDVFQHLAFESQSSEDRVYPSSLMGVIASIRQSFFDAQHYGLDRADYQTHPRERKRSSFDPSMEALTRAAEKKIRVVFEPGSALMADRAARVAGELGLEFCLVSCGQEWRRPDLAQATAATFIVPLNFPVLPKLPAEQDWDQVQLDQLRAWDWASENPVVLRRQGLEIALTTHGLEDKKKFRRNLKLALDRGLAETDALAALTTVPAKLCGVEAQLGTIEIGKIANLTVVSGESYFNPESKVREVWIDGHIYPAPMDEPKAAEEPTKAKGEAEAVAEGTSEASKAKEEPEKHPKPPEVAQGEKKTESSPASGVKKPEKKDEKKEKIQELEKTRTAHAPQEGRGPVPLAKMDLAQYPSEVVFRNATLWLCDEKGTVVTNGILWVKDGKIAGAGVINVPGSPGLVVMDGSGLNITPGLIDCHSHSAILGGVNESALPSSAMVRIHDVVNSETDNLYEQLAGGVTTVNLLHGSANPIGGQNCMIKLRDGASPEGLVFASAPAGIKFALGENVKQSNWGDRFATRFPQTRMGVRTFIANRFTAAQQYLEECDACRKAAGSNGSAAAPLPPRRDLELEALGEILQGTRWIHCHAYRQDEMLMLLRLMESFKVKIATFQHVLEGYKIADEIARHGAGGSSFSDWWAYKFEVYDAIPYNGSLMRDRGVVVSFNSDSSELARRLYSEAAKAVKYGGTPEPEALKFVTLNPAKQLRIDSHVGSLEVGKDADFAVWSKSPLDARTVCEQTWIEGKKYFDRGLNSERTSRLQKERNDLVAKARQLAKLSAGGGGGDSGPGEEEQFFRVALEHQYDGKERHCLDEE